MGRLVIITVGTTLIKNKEIADGNLIDYVEEQKNNANLKSFITSINNQIFEDCTEKRQQYIEETIRKLEKNFDAVLKRKGDITIREKVPAELSSLERFEDKYGALDNKSDQIVLICSDSHEGWVSARLLEIFLKENMKYKNLSLEKIDDLDANNLPDFEDKGLKELVNKIMSLSQPEDKDIHIIATGGYKAVTTYASITGMLRGIPVYYLHDSFAYIIKLRALPINVDFDLWRENKVRMELVIGRDKAAADNSFNSLDKRIKELIDSNGSTYEWTAAGYMLYKSYEDASKWSSLQARGISLLSYLENRELKDKYERFLLNLGNSIWIGDKVPEMVDHAIRHHQNLFGIAESFLVPLLENNKNFLSSEEIYVLLCVILLHDCGHSLPFFLSKPERNLFPTEIRTWHNILSYERLNPKYNEIEKSLLEKSLLRQLTRLWKNYNSDDEVTNEDMQLFWHNELETIAMIGLYHRKDMPLVSGEYNDDELPICEKYFSALNSSKLCFDSGNFTDNAVKIAALFRIIDNCDNQISRTGTEHEIGLRQEAAKHDIKAEETREEEAKDLLSAALRLVKDTNNIENDIKLEICKRRDLYYKAEHRKFKDRKEKEALKCEIRKYKNFVDNQVEKISNETCKNIIKKAVYMVREVSDRVDFKKAQQSHFEKHSKVERVSITPDFSDGKYKFTIKIYGKKPYIEDLDDLIKDSMESEYNAAKDALDKYNIEIKYASDSI